MSEQVYSIPMPSYLKKFILQEFKLEEPIQLNENNLFAREIMKVVTDHRRSKGFDKFDNKIDVILNQNISDFSVSIGKLAMVNESMTMIFKRCMYSFVKGQYIAGIPASKAIPNFLDLYGIRESEYKSETGYREYERYKNDEYGRSKKPKQIASLLS
jgi:hypothetical protein